MLEIATGLLTGGWNLAKMGFSALGNFLSKLDAQGVAGLFVALVLAYLAITQWGDERHWKKQSDRYERLYNQDHLAFGQTVLNYRSAAAKQKADDDAKNAATVARQQAVNQEKSDEYEARLAAARAEYRRLSAPPAHPGSAGAGVPVVSAPACGPPQASGQDRLPDALTATEQAIQLDELIKWVRAQNAIDPNQKVNP